MSMAEPIWWKYAIYEDEGGYPVLKGFRKDTPKEILEAFKKDQKSIKKQLDDGLVL